MERVYRTSVAADGGCTVAEERAVRQRDQRDPPRATPPDAASPRFRDRRGLSLRDALRVAVSSMDGLFLVHSKVLSTMMRSLLLTVVPEARTAVHGMPSFLIGQSPKGSEKLTGSPAANP